jgi:hypothetical protein
MRSGTERTSPGRNFSIDRTISAADRIDRSDNASLRVHSEGSAIV